jgi:hypothetical protein
MSSLPYDAFVRKVEEQIRQKNLNASLEANENHVDEADQQLGEHGKSEGATDGSESISASHLQIVTDEIQSSRSKMYPTSPLRNINRSSEPETQRAKSPGAKVEETTKVDSRSVSQPPHLSNSQPHDLGYGNGIAGMSSFPNFAFAQPLAQSQESPHLTTKTGFAIPQLTGTWLGNPTKMVVPQILNTQPFPQTHAMFPQYRQISQENMMPNPFVPQASMLGGQVLLPGQQLMTMPLAGQLPNMGTAGSLHQLSQVVPSLPQVLSLFPKFTP